MEPDINFNSPEWGKVRQYLEEELLDTYHRLSSLTTTVEDLRHLQGRAAFIVKLLGFGQ